MMYQAEDYHSLKPRSYLFTNDTQVPRLGMGYCHSEVIMYRARADISIIKYKFVQLESSSL